MALINAHLKDITGDAKIFFKDLQDLRYNLQGLREKAYKEGIVIANEDFISPIEVLLKDLLIGRNMFVPPFRNITMAGFVSNTIDKISILDQEMLDVLSNCITGDTKIFFKDLQDLRNNLQDLRSKACKEGIVSQDFILPMKDLLEDLLEDLLVHGGRIIPPSSKIMMAGFVINTISKRTNKILILVSQEILDVLRQ